MSLALHDGDLKKPMPCATTYQAYHRDGIKYFWCLSCLVPIMQSGATLPACLACIPCLEMLSIGPVWGNRVHTTIAGNGGKLFLQRPLVLGFWKGITMILSEMPVSFTCEPRGPIYFFVIEAKHVQSVPGKLPVFLVCHGNKRPPSTIISIPSYNFHDLLSHFHRFLAKARAFWSMYDKEFSLSRQRLRGPLSYSPFSNGEENIWLAHRKLSDRCCFRA